MDFPKWAPKALCDLYDRIPSSCCNGEPKLLEVALEKEFLERLLTAPEMELVWSACRQAFPQESPDPSTVSYELFNRNIYDPFEGSASIDNDLEEISYELYNVEMWTEAEIATYANTIPIDIDGAQNPYRPPNLSDKSCELFRGALLSYRASLEERLPASEQIEKFRNIASKAKELARAIKNTEFDMDTLISYLDREGERKYENVKWTVEADRDLENLFFHEVPIHKVLQRISLHAIERAELVKRDHRVQLVKNPRAAKAKANFFIRAMSEHFISIFGSPRYELLATLATVVLKPQLGEGKIISETNVASSLREWRKSLLKNK